ncbi:hypothetical protein [Brenneria goodwinii]|uniref:hypothetical protein n=1 Tax=Brenneria goodwinii TaxID=1109412 RepID=UPI0011AB34FE|nr:hypothetical protein [Brenneria goodwinii]
MVISLMVLSYFRFIRTVASLPLHGDLKEKDTINAYYNIEKRSRDDGGALRRMSGWKRNDFNNQ